MEGEESVNPVAEETVDADETFGADENIEEPAVSAHMVPATPDVMRRRNGPPMSHRDHEKVLEKRLAALYASIDTDSDGKLSGAEIKAKLDADDEIEELMALAGKSIKNIGDQLDKNQDGMVSLEEFLKMLTQQGFEYNFDWLVEQVVFQKQHVENRRLNVLTVEEGYDVSTVKADAELIPFTMDYVPTVHSLKMVSDDGDKYSAQGLGLYGETDVMW